MNLFNFNFFNMNFESVCLSLISNEVERFMWKQTTANKAIGFIVDVLYKYKNKDVDGFSELCKERNINVKV